MGEHEGADAGITNRTQRGSAGRTGRLLLVAYRRAGFGGKQVLWFSVVWFYGFFVRNELCKVLMH